MKYQVGFKGTSNLVTIEADTELEALSKYCKKNKLTHTLIAPNLEVKKLEKGNKNNEVRNR